MRVRLRIPYRKGLGADSEEKREPVSDIDTVGVDSLKVLDPERPIREADILLVVRLETRIVFDMRIQAIDLADTPCRLLVARSAAFCSVTSMRASTEQDCGQCVFAFESTRSGIEQLVQLHKTSGSL
jgi:hypothetical protein